MFKGSNITANLGAKTYPKLLTDRRSDTKFIALKLKLYFLQYHF
jgi:hypothetical protein